jgi:hypothetical protein
MEQQKFMDLHSQLRLINFSSFKNQTISIRWRHCRSKASGFTPNMPPQRSLWQSRQGLRTTKSVHCPKDPEQPLRPKTFISEWKTHHSRAAQSQYLRTLPWLCRPLIYSLVFHLGSCGGNLTLRLAEGSTRLWSLSQPPLHSTNDGRFIGMQDNSRDKTVMLKGIIHDKNCTLGETCLYKNQSPWFFCVLYRGQVSYILRHRSYGVEGRSSKLMGECYTHDKIDRQVMEDLERDWTRRVVLDKVVGSSWPRS